MATFKSLDAIILSLLDYIRIVQPDADTTPGTVFRDVAIDPTAQELSKLYVELRNIANLQSYSAASGSSLDRLAANFSAVRGAGSAASGVAVLTVASLDSDVSIPAGTSVTARNGVRFRTLASTSFAAANSGVYRANASRLRSGLDSAGIADQFALEVAVQAVSPGASGNIGKFSLTGQNISGISNITNTEPFSGGSNAESDATFRARILSIFAGSNIGTALGYINTLRADSRIIDVLAVEPGDPLMTRDGSQVSTSSSGDIILVEPGTGGKVDLYIQGSGLQTNVESYIHKDRSGRGDATSPLNNFVLGQRGISTALNFQQRRREAIRNGQLPLQPVTGFNSVTGSSSGANFIEKFVDSAGVTHGNYELLKDSGAFAGSNFGYDSLHWISNQIDLPDEVITKGIFNGQDATLFSDIREISDIHQNIAFRGESATLSSSDRSIINLQHTPVVTVDRVFNATTGERYTIANVNPDGGAENTSGAIKISGNSLPAPTDSIEVNYLWKQEYDRDVDYDNLSKISPFRTVQDSIDWGYSNRINLEKVTLTFSVSDGYRVVVTHPASRVLDVSTLQSEIVTNNSGKLTVGTTIINILDIKDSSGREVFNTKLANGSFTGSEITLPTDSSLENGQLATVRYNLIDQFSPDGYDLGTFTGNIIKLPLGIGLAPGTTLYASYVADLNTILPTTSLANLPAVVSANSFIVNGATVGSQPITNIFSQNTIVRNLRFAPSYLRINLQGIPSRGRLTIAGKSYTRIEDIVVVTQNGLTFDLKNSILNKMGLSSIPASGFVARVASVQRVTVTSDQQISSTDFTFDLLNYELLNNSYSNATAFINNSLSTTQFKLTDTELNLDNEFTTGQKLKIVYYYCDSSQIENITAGTAGIYYSKFKYASISSISVASGFTTTSGIISGNITITNANQPVSGTSYLTSYSYTAPKEGERITISYNYNKLITDATFAIENVRPITADVLIKQASPLIIDVALKFIPLPTFIQSVNNVQQALEEAITIFVTATGLNTTLDASDIINAAYQVAGVDRITLTKFNLSGKTGLRQTISAGRNEYIVAGAITVEPESR